MCLNNEYPLSRINVDINKIEAFIFPNSILEGQFNIRNITKGNLCGKITSNIYGLEFEPDYFESNECTIKYKYKSQPYAKNIQGEINIQSNGGEIVILVTINIKPNELIIDNYKINSLDSFAKYASDNFSKAQEIFFSDNFLDICNISSLNLIRLYEKLILSEHKQRVMENFLIASDKKNAAILEIIKPKIELIIKCFEEKKIKYKIPLSVICKVKGWGNLDCLISNKNTSKWLEIITTDIKIDDVSNINDLEISFIVDPNLIETKIVNDFIIIANGNFKISFELSIKKESIFSIETSKLYYNINESGIIKVYNNAREDVMIEIDTYDKIIKFKSKKYFISSYAEIPFDININKTLEFRKTPIYNSTISVKTIIRGKVYKKYLDIKIIDSKLKQIYD